MQPLQRNLPKNIEIRKNVTLAPFTTFQIGGPADLYAVAHNAFELAELVLIARKNDIPFFLLGKGANILISDQGFRGLVIHNKANAIFPDHAQKRIKVESGAIVYPNLIEQTINLGWSGLEHYAGIPSTVGGALWQNLHFLSPAPARERTMFIEEVTYEAEILDASGQKRTVGRDYFNFSYDYSTLHDTEDVVLTATFQLEPSSPEEMRRVVGENLAWRAARHPPLDTEPSAGSIFKKIEGIGAGRLIDECGMKGTRIGGIEITHRHANIMINRGGGTAADVRQLIERVQETVLTQTGYALEPEILFVGDF